MSQLNLWAKKAKSLVEAKRWREAAVAYARLIAAGGSGYDIHFLYGMTLMRCDLNEAARDQLHLALRYRPDSIEALNSLAAAHTKAGNPCAAEAVCRQILEKKPEHHAAWSNLGSALCQQGRIPEGLEAFERAFELVPNDGIIRDNLLLNLNYIATDGHDLAEVHRMLCANLPSRPRKPIPDVTRRRIRVGYVSSDFRSHSVSFFMAGVIGTHDRTTTEVHCYSTTPVPDGRTNDFRQLAEHFADLSTCSDAKAAELIAGDQIDVLVDLGGHTSGNRLGIFALRPAPVQVSYLGYPATTGCSFIDYRMVDALTDPEGSESFSTERLVRLPAPFLTYYPHTTFPPTAPLPALENGYVTFGSFNHSSKISDETLDLWSGVLGGIPDSRMFIKARAFSDDAVCEQFRERFSLRGIDPSRLVFSGLLEGAQEHLAAYGKVDIALDTFPYNGTTTTCEALWMGVPVITMAGSLHAARVGLTILTAVGLANLATTSAEDFVALATALSEDLHQLAALRNNLQQIVKRSPLCDRFRLTQGLENAYREMLTTQR